MIQRGLMQRLRTFVLMAVCLLGGGSFLFLSRAQAQLSASTTLQLLNASAATGAQQMWPGGMGVFAVNGTFGGATVTLQFVGPDGTTLITAGAATTLTANGAGVFYLPKGLVQATITGGTGISLYASAKPLPNLIG